jgi:hypothetical protein
MVVGSTSFGEVVGLLSSAEEQLAREINAVVYPVPEFKEKSEGRSSLRQHGARR